MFDPNRILELVGLVGFEDDPKYDIKDLTDSSSGLKFQNVTPLLTLTNLYDSYTQIEITDFPSYNAGTTYSKGDYVNDTGLFRYINENSASGNATADTSYWEPYTPFAKFLRDKIEGYMVDVFNDWMTVKELKQAVVGIITAGETIKVKGSHNDLSDIGSDYPAFLFKVNQNKGLIMNVESIEFHLDSDVTFDLKLFQRGKKTPIETESIVYTGNGSTQSFTLDYKLAPGFYYFTADYGAATPINSLMWGTLKNQRSVGFDTARISQISEYEDDFSYVTDNHGMNLKYSLYCDYTDLFLEQKRNFERIIQYGTAIKFLEWVAFNPDAEVTRHLTKINVKDVEFQLYGDTQGKFRTGLYYKYEQMLKGASLSIVGIDKICLPCKTKGVTVKSI